MKHRERKALALCTYFLLSLFAVTGADRADEPDSAPDDSEAKRLVELSMREEVLVEAREDDLTGIATSATEGATGAEDLAKRPILRSGEIVETVPGVIATQHSGGGKANQYFLRGFNLDHATDLRINVEGMQVNFPTHGHGQGYADLSFLIPEFIETVQFRKGLYRARDGDFSSAGATDIRMVDDLPRSTVLASLGGNDFQRVLLAGSTGIAEGRLLAAFELFHYDGPWVRPDDFQKLNGLLRYSNGDELSGWSIAAMGYDGEWDATDQIPLRAAGSTIDRFGMIDPDLGGESSRYSLSGEVHRVGQGWSRDVSAYVLAYDLDLLSNFTYCLDGGDAMTCEIDDDQFLQRDARTVFGSRFDQNWNREWGGRLVQWGVGAEIQFHSIDNGLFRTENGAIRPGAIGTIRADAVDQWIGGIYADAEVRWNDRFRTVAGLRGDFVDVDVSSDLAQNSGTRSDSIASPRFSLVFGPWNKSEVYLNYGQGFHSNDARGMVTTVDPVSLAPVSRADPLVRSETADFGFRTTAVEGLQSTLSLFWIELDSELVFVGDAGTTEPGPPSRRVGVEWNNFYRVKPWLALDLDVTYADAEFLDVPAGQEHIPGALEETVAAGVALGRDDGWFGSVRWRYFGGFPLTEDDSVRGSSTSLVNGRVGYAFAKGLRIVLDVFNLLDREDADIQYYYASRLPASFSPSGTTEPEDGVEDVHFHPMESRTFRLWVEYAF
jgi:outer membrane receptor protein involved in Fe transport